MVERGTWRALLSAPFWFNFAETRCFRKSHINSKTQEKCFYWLIIHGEHNYAADVQPWWFMDESLARGVSERWCGAEAAAGNVFCSQVCHLLFPLQALALTRIIQTVARLCCKSRKNELWSKPEQRFGLSRRRKNVLSSPNDLFIHEDVFQLDVRPGFDSCFFLEIAFCWVYSLCCIRRI